MALKSLPLEGQSSQQNFSTTDRENILDQIKKRLQLKEISHDEKVVDKACYKMISYIQHGKKFSLDELKDLLNSLERSILTIQKRKKYIVEKAHRRNR